MFGKKRPETLFNVSDPRVKQAQEVANRTRKPHLLVRNGLGGLDIMPTQNVSLDEYGDTRTPVAIVHPEPLGEQVSAIDYQSRVRHWVVMCFGEEVANNVRERNFRFLEEALELVQANGATADEARELIDYVFNRPVGEVPQEVGGVMTTLAALCCASKIDMYNEARTELSRIVDPAVVEKIRAKQASKPKPDGPLPGSSDEQRGPTR